jgi:hypothetical protein
MIATNPIVIGEKSFDLFSLNLAITGKYNADGSSDANVAMRLIPTRIEDGEVITADAEAKGIALGSLAGSDEATQQAVASIQTALQQFILSKGL